MKYLTCLLNDSDYAYPNFVVESDEKSAVLNAMQRYCDTLDSLGVIEVEKKEEDRKPLWRLSQTQNDHFHVTEIFSFDETKGSHLLVWHHAYEGVDFGILSQGSYEECLNERKRQIRKNFEEYDYSDGDNEDFDIETDNVIDTGIEWEVYSIVDVAEQQCEKEIKQRRVE